MPFYGMTEGSFLFCTHLAVSPPEGLLALTRGGPLEARVVWTMSFLLTETAKPFPNQMLRARRSQSGREELAGWSFYTKGCLR